MFRSFTVNWAIVPADPGTRKVVTAGIVVLYDPAHLFKNLLANL